MEEILWFRPFFVMSLCNFLSSFMVLQFPNDPLGGEVSLLTMVLGLVLSGVRDIAEAETRGERCIVAAIVETTNALKWRWNIKTTTLEGRSKVAGFKIRARLECDSKSIRPRLVNF